MFQRWKCKDSSENKANYDAIAQGIKSNIKEIEQNNFYGLMMQI